MVNKQSLKIDGINMEASIVRLGGLNGGGRLVINYFSKKEEEIIINGHKACIKHDEAITKAFRLATGIDDSKHKNIERSKRNPKTVEKLKTKSTVWILIIILYHAVQSPQLHATGFGRDKYKDILKNEIKDKKDLKLIIAYVNCIFDTFGRRYKLLCKQLGINYNEFVAFQTQHYYPNDVTKLGLRLNGHRDTWKLGDRGFAAGTFMNASTIVFTDRYNQRIIFELDKPPRSL